MMINKKQAWIDLVALSTRCVFQLCLCKARVVIEHHNIETKDLFIYQLRVALRAVGHKITCWDTATDRDTNKEIVICYTSITDPQTYQQAIDWFDDWTREVIDDGSNGECDCGEGSESESESETEDENPSN
jgi:hypothetical protein